MDLYQIFVTHNRPWSVREIVVFTVLFLGLAVLLLYLAKQKKIFYSQAVSGMILFAFLGIVFGATVFARESNGVHQYELELFWSWKLALRGDDASMSFSQRPHLVESFFDRCGDFGGD